MISHDSTLDISALHPKPSSTYSTIVRRTTSQTRKTQPTQTKMHSLISSALLLLSVTTHPQTVHAIPTQTQHQTSQIADKHTPSAWQLSLYQNTHCTGETTFHSGNGTRPCAASILNGGALAYIPVVRSGSNCRITLFGDELCSRAETVGVVVGGEGGLKGRKVKCQVPEGEGGGKEIRSFRVVC